MKIKINGIEVEVEQGTTILEAAKFLGLDIPTLCAYEGLTPFGGCRLCIVEIGKDKTKLVSSCTYKVEEELIVRTHSEKVIKTRKMLIELLLAMCPTSKVVQDLASKHNVKQVRFKIKNEQCILCGLCVRICEEQMMAKAIGFVNRGEKRKITTPFNEQSEVCRRCGACIYICPACQLRCLGPEQIEGNVCGSCVPLQPSCIESYEDFMCYMGETGSCGTCVKKESPVRRD